MLKKYLIIIGLSLLALHVACGDGRENGGKIDTATIDAKPQEFLFERLQPAIKILTRDRQVADPLADAMGMLGLTATDLVRPLYHEEGYIMLARLAVVDRVASSPFMLKSWADETSRALKKSSQAGLLTLALESLKIIDGYSESFPQVGYRFDNALGVEGAYRQLCQNFNHAVLTEQLQEIKNAGFNQQFDLRLGQLLQTITKVAETVDEAFSDLSPEEVSRLIENPEKYFYPDGLNFNFLTAPTHEQVEFVSMARRIQYPRLIFALLSLCSEIDEFSRYLSQVVSSNSATSVFSGYGKEHSGSVLKLPSPIGNIVLLGQGDDSYTGAAALLIDLGGDDSYFSEGRTGLTVQNRVSVIIDAGGNDQYAAADGRFAQGAGIAGIHIQSDLSGDDRYIAGDMSQGCGMFGFGILSDREGNDTYQMGLMGQGFGLFGMGILVDLNGNDRYIIDGLGQGAGSTMGFGGLCDLSGDDEYTAGGDASQQGRLKADDWAHAQGVGLSVRSPDWRRNFSIYGGVGFLNDGAGNDIYHCSKGNCMGAGYFMSVGALVDDSGNDLYEPEDGNGMGFAVHLASGILIDREGNDTYIAKNDSGGVGADRSFGMLADYKGDDLYGPRLSHHDLNAADNRVTSGSAAPKFIVKTEAGLPYTSYASASRPKGLGFLLDYDGDDHYFARREERSASCAAVIPPADPRNWSHALLLDLGGNDGYYPLNRDNNSYHIDLEHGLFYDIDYQGDKNPINNDMNFQVDDTQSIVTRCPDMPKASPSLQKEIVHLNRADNFQRFASVGRLMRESPDIIDDLIDTLQSSKERDANLSLMEILNYFILRKEMTRSRALHFVELIHACDPAVRIYAARTLGWWELEFAGRAIVNALKDPVPEVRAQIFWTLGRIGNRNHLSILDDTFANETSQRCKRAATKAFQEILSRKDIGDAHTDRDVLGALLKWIGDSDSIVRRDAALGLRYIRPTAEGIQALIDALNDPDVYVVRAASKSLAFNGRKEGLPVLIETLKFPSIDTGEYYDQELVKDLAFFCGTDFPGEIRYDYKIWKEWWSENGPIVDINENLVIMKMIEKAFAQEDVNEGLRILDKLLSAHPSNKVIKLRYVRFCQDWITYRLMTKEKIDRETLEICLRLQKKIVALAPKEPHGLSVLASFYARLSKLDDAVAVMKTVNQLDPGNLKYQSALKYYQTLKKSRSNGN
jgi:hypothetical protein